MPGTVTLIIAYIILTVLAFLIGIGMNMFESDTSILKQIRRSIGIVFFGWFMLIIAVAGVILFAAAGFLNFIFCFTGD